MLAQNAELTRRNIDPVCQLSPTEPAACEVSRLLTVVHVCPDSPRMLLPHWNHMSHRGQRLGVRAWRRSVSTRHDESWIDGLNVPGWWGRNVRVVDLDRLRMSRYKSQSRFEVQRLTESHDETITCRESGAHDTDEIPSEGGCSVRSGSQLIALRYAEMGRTVRHVSQAGCFAPMNERQTDNRQIKG